MRSVRPPGTWLLELLLLLATISVAHGLLPEASAGWLGAFGPLADQNAALTVFPVLLVPSGGRVEGMGTAGAAMADDAAAMEVNPAAAAQRERMELGLYHHQWYADASVESLIFTLGRGIGGLVLGVKALAVPFTSYDDAGTPLAAAHYAELLAVAGGALRIVSLPGLSVCVGASLKVAASWFPASVLAGQSALGFPLDVGVLAELRLLDLDLRGSRRNVSVGAVVRNFGQGALPSGLPLPTVLCAGATYSPVQALVVAVELGVPVSFDPETAPAERPVVAAGASVAITSFLSVHGGARIAGDNPRFTLGSAVSLRRVRLVFNCTLDFLSGFDVTDLFSVASVIDLTGVRHSR